MFGGVRALMSVLMSAAVLAMTSTAAVAQTAARITGVVRDSTGAPLGDVEDAARRHRSATLDAYLTHDDTRTTLAELGAFLVQEGCQAALNLDGGPSTAAAFRDGEKLLTVGLGEALPYGLAFD